MLWKCADAVLSDKSADADADADADAEGYAEKNPDPRDLVFELKLLMLFWKSKSYGTPEAMFIFFPISSRIPLLLALMLWKCADTVLYDKLADAKGYAKGYAENIQILETWYLNWSFWCCFEKVKPMPEAMAKNYFDDSLMQI